MNFSKRIRRTLSVALIAGLSGLPTLTLVTTQQASAIEVGHVPTTSTPIALVVDSGSASLDKVSPTQGVVGQIFVGADPYAVAVTPNGSTAWVVDKTGDEVWPVNLANSAVGTPVSVGSSPEAIAINPAGTLALVANTGNGSSSGTVSVIQLSSGGGGSVQQTIAVGNSFSLPSAIAITPDGSTAYVADFGAGQVVPINLSNDQVGTPISVGNGSASDPMALAITPNGKTLYVVLNGNQSVVPVTIATNTPGTAISVGSAPDAIAINPTGTLAYVANFGSNSVTPITLSNNTAQLAFNVGQKPTGVSFSPDGSNAFVSNFGDGTLTTVQVTSSSGSPSSTPVTLPTGSAINGSPASTPSGVTFIPDQGPKASLSIGLAQAGSSTTFNASGSSPGTSPIVSYAFSFGDGTPVLDSVSPVVQHTYALAGTYSASVTVTDEDGVSTSSIFTGQTMTGNAALSSTGAPQASVGESISVEAATSSAAPVAYVSESGTGAIVPISVDGGVVGQTISLSTPSTPEAVAITPDGTEALVVDKTNNSIWIVNTLFNTLLGSIPVNGSEPVAIAISPDGNEAIVADSGSAQISVINLITRSVNEVSVGTDPTAVAFTPDGSLAFIANSGSNSVSVFNVSQGSVVNTLSLGAGTGPDALSVTPNGSDVWVAEGSSGQVIPLIVSNVETSGSGSIGAGGSDIGQAISVGVQPDALAVTPNGQALLVANAGSGTITPISLSGSPTPENPVDVGTSISPTSGRPDALAVVPSGGTLLVADGANSTVDEYTLATGSGAVALSFSSSVALSNASAPEGLAVIPDQHPVATFTVAPGLAPQASVFNASGSLAPSSSIVSYAWTFGDGSSAVTTTPIESHVYSQPGTYEASVVETDANGGSTTGIYTGQTASASGGSSASFAKSFTISGSPLPPSVSGIEPPAGSVLGGETVTVTGADLTGAVSVDFGPGNPAKILTDSSVSMTVTAPAGTPGPVDVTVTTAVGQSAVNIADTFSYVTAPSISSFRPTTGTTVGGTVVTLQGSSLSNVDQASVGGKIARIVSSTPTSLTLVTPPGVAGSAQILLSNRGVTGAPASFTYVSPATSGVGACVSTLPAGSVVGVAETIDSGGYWIVNSAGEVANFGDAVCYGSMTGASLNAPIVGITADPLTGGYWLLGADGGVYSFDAPFFGSTGGMKLNAPVVAMSATPSGNGYLFVASDGGVFAFGGAQFYGSAGNLKLNAPVVGMSLTSSGDGYWLVGKDGGIFSYGNAQFFGSMGGSRLNKPVVSMVADPSTGGYWLVASDGGVFSFGAPFMGSTGNISLAAPVVAMTATNGGLGYIFVAADGGIFNYGDASFFGSGVGS